MFKQMLMNCLLLLVLAQVKAQVVQITPEKPQRGKSITVIYRPGVAGALIGKNATSVMMSFPYSTFYELPYKLPMTKQGDNWVASFVLQRYATFACFTFVSGDVIDRPSPESMYTIPVYKGDKRIFNSYLHEAYSLSAQMPKSPSLLTKQMELYQKELSVHPDNYEAKVRVEATKMAMAKTPADKEKYRAVAMRIIAEKLEENPTFSGNINSVTMGYLIIGEKTRTDSVRRAVAERFPKSDQGKSYRIKAIMKEQDTAGRIVQLEALLKESDEAGAEGSTEVHEILFQHYAAIGNAAKAAYHARRSLEKGSPFIPEKLKDIAVLFTKKKLAPDTAIAIAAQALSAVEKWPVGVIRYFPEFGYILPFVADSVRARAVAKAKSELFAILAVNKLRIGDRAAALNYAAQSENAGFSRAGLIDIATVYEGIGDSKKSYEALWKVLQHEPSDKEVVGLAKTSFMKFNNNESKFKASLKELEALKIEKLKPAIRQMRMNKPGPELSGITDLQGKKVTSDMMKGKIVVLDFWATWCVPCMEEMPYFQNVYEKYKDNPGVMFMVVNTGSNNTIKDAVGWAEKNTKYTFPIYFNNDKNIAEKVGFNVIPTIAVLDEKGLMQFRTIGFEGAELEYKLSAQIDVLLGK